LELLRVGLADAAIAKTTGAARSQKQVHARLPTATLFRPGIRRALFGHCCRDPLPCQMCETPPTLQQNGFIKTAIFVVTLRGLVALRSVRFAIAWGDLR